MRRMPLMIVILASVLSMLLVACSETTLDGGVRDQEEPSAVDLALADYRDMPVATREPALRELIVESADQAAYGWYGLGNLFYERSANENVPPGPDSQTGTSAMLDSALTCYQTAIAVDSTLVEAWVNMGLIWDDLSDGRTPLSRKALTNAQEAYGRAIDLKPSDEKARCNLGALLFRRRQHPEAMEQFQAVLDRNPKSALAHYNLAIMFAESQMYREAVTEWQLAVDNDPDGDIGERSRDNIKVIEQLMSSTIPEELKAGGSS